MDRTGLVLVMHAVNRKVKRCIKTDSQTNKVPVRRINAEAAAEVLM